MDRLLKINDLTQLSIDQLSKHTEDFQDTWQDRID